MITNRSTEPRRGFALIIVVALLALLILVLISLATLTQIEAGIGANSRLHAQARQNARFALDLAMGELQRHAGPDQRTTATAGISGAVDHPHWTGVWRGGVPQSWLVSGNENRTAGNPDAVPILAAPVFTTGMTVDTVIDIAGVPAVTLVGPRTAGTASVAGYVAAPRIEIRGTAPDGTADALLGRYAWWVGDEGTKARVNLIDRLEPVADEIAQRARHRVLQRTGVEAMTQFSAVPVNAVELPRVLMNNQLSFLASGAPGPAAVRNRFHDFTTASRGVMADAAAGGLRRDVSAYLSSGDAASLDPAFSTRSVATGVSMAYASSWANRAPGTSGFGASVAPAEFSATQHGVHPVLIRHSHFFGLSYVLNQLRVHYMPVITLWNPYDIAISGQDYVIEVDIPFEFSFTGIGVSGGQPPVGTLWFVVPDLDFEPGEVRLLSASGATPWAAYSTPGATVTNQLLPGWRPDCAFHFPPTGNLTTVPPDPVGLVQTGPASPGAVRLRLGDSTTSPLLQEISGGPAFPAYALQVRPEVPISDSSLGAPALLFYDDMVAHGWSLQPASGDAWVALSHRVQPAATWSQHEVGSPRGRGFAGYSWLRPTGLNDPNAGQPVNIFWHVPRGGDVPILSLADLQHVRLPGTTWRPRYLWDPGSGATVAAGFWDAYFVSGLAPTLLQSDIDNPDYVPAFGRMRFLRRGGMSPARENLVYVAGAAASAPVETSAAHILIDGVFNVNSVSTDAWRALFASLGGTPVANGSGDVETTTEVGASPIRHPYARTSFPYAASLNPDDPALSAAGGDIVDLRNSAEAWAGYRRLTDREVESLATQWAAHVAGKGAPYASIAAFVDDAFWETSIAAAGINDPSWTDVGGPPSGLSIPGVLTKWDLIARMLPVLAVRSDTFTIRAYGETVNPVTGQSEARAWCEAVVQRLPEYVDTTLDPWAAPAVGSQNEKFGRRFVITSFRWLSPDDI